MKIEGWVVAMFDHDQLKNIVQLSFTQNESYSISRAAFLNEGKRVDYVFYKPVPATLTIEDKP